MIEDETMTCTNISMDAEPERCQSYLNRKEVAVHKQMKIWIHYCLIWLNWWITKNNQNENWLTTYWSYTTSQVHKYLINKINNQSVEEMEAYWTKLRIIMQEQSKTLRTVQPVRCRAINFTSFREGVVHYMICYYWSQHNPDWKYKVVGHCGPFTTSRKCYLSKRVLLMLR